MPLPAPEGISVLVADDEAPARQRIIDLLRIHGRRLRTVREFVLEATIARGTWPDTFRTVSRLLAEFRGPEPGPR